MQIKEGRLKTGKQVSDDLHYCEIRSLMDERFVL